MQVFKVFLKGTQTLLYEAWPHDPAVRTGLTFVSSLVFCTNTRTLGKTVYFSHDPSETVPVTPDKEHPKVTIVTVIFLVCIVRLDKPVIDPQMEDLEELLVATSFPLNSTRRLVVLLRKWGHNPIQLRPPATTLKTRLYPHTEKTFLNMALV